MRDKIRLPADVEFSTKFLNGGVEGEENGQFRVTIDSEPAGKFNKVKRVLVELVVGEQVTEVLNIVPKERTKPQLPPKPTAFVKANRTEGVTPALGGD